MYEEKLKINLRSCQLSTWEQSPILRILSIIFELASRLLFCKNDYLGLSIQLDSNCV